ncbi:MAG: terpene cyclase/mutase family protein [Phycisphaerae bacterium]|jgi:hypothetical protein|nr:terpene cyclase/mutase family protein [Phycisphaerae bacterium]
MQRKADNTDSKTPPMFDWRPRSVEVVNKRAVLVGTLIFTVLVAISVFWKLYPAADTKANLKEFQFSVDEPVVEKFELSDPKRDLILEQPEELADETELDERPDIRMTITETDVVMTEEFVQTQNIEVDTPEISLDATEVDIDAPEEITEESPNVAFALNPIAATVSTPADIFKYKNPVPAPDKAVELHWINRAPKPSRNVKALPKTFGRQDATPAIGKLGPTNMALFGTGDFFRTMTRFGGVKAKASVDGALAWLARHQEPDGHWDAKKYGGAANADVGVTGLAVLALMGGGNTTRKGEYRRNVLRGLQALIRMQNKAGLVASKSKGNLYNHAIATIALCEAYGRARDERVGLAARLSVDFLAKAVNPDGGWRYTPNCGESDMSVTAWCIQAFKTAKLARIKFDHALYSRSLSYVDSVTHDGASSDSSGAVGYMFSQQQSGSDGHPALTAAGVLVRQFSGTGVKSHLLVKGAALMRKQAPSWKSQDFYLWYYATYAMHNMGGENRVWWNRRVRDVLVENQCKTGDNEGSWDYEQAKWGKRAGRVYTTALGALCLEVYYRYSAAMNSFGVAPDLDDLFLQ